MLTFRSIVLALVTLALFPCIAPAQEPGAAWAPFQFLVGEWRGVPQGKPGEAAGGFTFAWDLDHRVLSRRGWNDSPATAGRPASSHKDIMTIYHDNGRAHAVYFDNEGHVIHYRAAISPDGRSITFLSEPTASAPGFRLVYHKETDDLVKIAFAIAPPGKPNGFKIYLEGSAERVKPKPPGK